MPTRPRTVLSLLLALLAAALVAGCGGGGAADGRTDVQELLNDTFSGARAIESARLDGSLGVRTGGGRERSVNGKFGGPFQSTGEGRLPKFALHGVLAGGRRTVEGGVTSTGEEGYVNVGGTDYAVPAPLFRMFEARYEQAARTSGQRGQSLASLGIDPRRWLVNARNAGESRVGDTETVRITGDVDVPKLLDDVDRALARVGSLGLPGYDRLPGELKRRAADAIKRVHVEIDTGADDRILRRLAISMSVEKGAGTADVRFALQLLDVNEDQQIEAPENPRPFKELASKLGLAGLDGRAGSSLLPTP